MRNTIRLSVSCFSIILGGCVTYWVLSLNSNLQELSTTFILEDAKISYPSAKVKFTNETRHINFGTKNTSESIGKFLVIGAISYPGYIVSNVLKATTSKSKTSHCCEIKITEDVSSLGFDSGTWKNWDKLKEIDMTPSIVNYSDKEIIRSQLEWLQNGTIIYIPSLFFNAIHTDSIFDLKLTASLLKTFTNILEAAANFERATRVIIFSVKKGLQASRHAVAIRLLSLIMSSYTSQNSTLISLSIENHNVPHDVYCCNVEELSEVIKSSLKVSFKHSEYELKCTCLEDQKQPLPISDVASENIVMSTHFTHRSWYRKNGFEFMRGFFMTAVQHGFSILIFHDELSTYFQDQVKRYYTRTEMVKVNNLSNRKMNDARFYELNKYLLHKPNVRNIVLQDIRDGTFEGNPFKVMDLIGDLLYVGRDIAFYVSERDYFNKDAHLFKQCFPEGFSDDVVEYHPFFNAGTIGGTRDVMLTFLTRLTQCLDRAPHQKKCNMACVGWVTHHYFLDHSYTGYPFQSGYKAGIAVSQGLAIRHKETGYV